MMAWGEETGNYYSRCKVSAMEEQLETTTTLWDDIGTAVTAQLLATFLANEQTYQKSSQLVHQDRFAA